MGKVLEAGTVMSQRLENPCERRAGPCQPFEGLVGLLEDDQATGSQSGCVYPQAIMQV